MLLNGGEKEKRNGFWILSGVSDLIKGEMPFPAFCGYQSTFSLAIFDSEMGIGRSSVHAGEISCLFKIHLSDVGITEGEWVWLQMW